MLQLQQHPLPAAAQPVQIPASSLPLSVTQPRRIKPCTCCTAGTCSSRVLQIRLKLDSGEQQLHSTSSCSVLHEPLLPVCPRSWNRPWMVLVWGGSCLWTQQRVLHCCTAVLQMKRSTVVGARGSSVLDDYRTSSGTFIKCGQQQQQQQQWWWQQWQASVGSRRDSSSGGSSNKWQQQPCQAAFNSIMVCCGFGRSLLVTACCNHVIDRM